MADQTLSRHERIDHRDAERGADHLAIFPGEYLGDRGHRFQPQLQPSRALSAYRYFPTQESLLLDVANVEALLKPVEDLVASFPTDDAAQRLAALAGTFTQAMLSDEALIRTGERIYMDTWLANQPDGNRTPVRACRRMRYIDEALRPLGDRLGESGRKRLRCALALALGTHAVIAMKDSAGLDDDEEIVATLEWAAGALLRTALQDFEQPQ